MGKTSISWTEETINPVTGCDRCSLGCKHCYMFTMIPRLKGMGQPKYQNGTTVTCHPGIMDGVLKKKKPTRYFVNSMSDTFHKDVPGEFIHELFDIMNQAKQHTFMVLTKRTERLAEMAIEFKWTPNIMAGVTVESNRYLHRINDLKKVPAYVRFLSIEPLLDELVDLTPEMLEGIDLVIVGGESGVGAREMKPEWARTIRDMCKATEIPFWFKQMGSHGGKPHKGGNKLDGKVHEEWPDMEAIMKRGSRFKVYNIVSGETITFDNS